MGLYYSYWPVFRSSGWETKRPRFVLVEYAIRCSETPTMYRNQAHGSIGDDEPNVLSSAMRTKRGRYVSQPLSPWGNVFGMAVSPPGLSAIGERAFNYCRNLTSVTIPASLTSWGAYTFKGCSSLKSVTIPAGVVTVGYRAFEGCNSLASVELPAGLTAIGAYAFWNCGSLASITIPASVASWGEAPFLGCSSLTRVELSPGLMAIGDGALAGCSGLTGIEIPSSVTMIGSGAFSGSGLVDITIPSGVTSIGSEAFYGCRSLVSITIPASVTEIGKQTFDFCSGLKSVYVCWKDPSVIKADAYAFANAGCESCILYVPQGTSQEYKSTAPWSGFENIVEYEVSGIDHISQTNDIEEVARYGTDGRLLPMPAKGLNIVKFSDGSIRKVIVK